MPRGEYQPRHHEHQQEDRVRDALQTLEQGIDAILTEEGFARYLRMMARLPHYSAGNLALIYAQRQDATAVAGYRRWQELGRQVKKGEKGIIILVPHKRTVRAETEEDEERVIVRGFGTATVFDIAATDGPDAPTPPTVEPIAGASDVGMRLYVDLLGHLETQGVPVHREELARANGYWDPIARAIGIGTHIDGDQVGRRDGIAAARPPQNRTCGFHHIRLPGVTYNPVAHGRFGWHELADGSTGVGA